MSNYHYREGNCPGCLEKGAYSSLQDTTNYSCDQPCLCRFTSERSDKDKMYYDWFVKGKPMVLPTPPGVITEPWKKINSARR